MYICYIVLNLFLLCIFPSDATPVMRELTTMDIHLCLSETYRHIRDQCYCRPTLNNPVIDKVYSSLS